MIFVNYIHDFTITKVSRVIGLEIELIFIIILLLNPNYDNKVSVDDVFGMEKEKTKACSEKKNFNEHIKLNWQTQ